MKSLWEFLSCEVVADITSSGTPSSFLSQPLSSFTWISLTSLSPSGCISILFQDRNVNFPMIRLHLCSIWISFPALSLLIYLLHFHFVGQFSIILFFFNVTWVYHWKARKQHNYILCCLWMNWMRCAVTNYQQTLKSDMIVHSWMHIQHDPSWFWQFAFMEERIFGGTSPFLLISPVPFVSISKFIR